MLNNEYKLRRNRLLKQIGSSSVAIIPAAKECIRSGSQCYPYRQNSDFYYLTGFVEPESLAVFVPDRKEGEYILFNRPRDFAKERWDGVRVGQDCACSEFGADQSFVITDVDSIMPTLLVGIESIYFSIGFDSSFDLRVSSWINQARVLGNGIKIPSKLINLDGILHEMRIKKSQFELDLMCRAIEITTSGFLKVMRNCKVGVCEFELEAELLYEFMRLGGRYESFKTIIAGGANACTLHYSKSDKPLNFSELLLLDAGVEYGNYCSDVTRTFPVNGKFTPEQRAIYEIVLEAQLAVIAQIRPGVRFDVLQSTAERIITERLVDLGLLRGTIDELVLQQAFKVFFPHKIGHWVGLDVHDVGEYRVNNEWRILEPGMVLTVEPGIYVNPENTIDSKWWNIGVRIEDEVLVTEDGNNVLTEGVPKSIIDIEKLMNSCF